jgi:hypothetical protein
MNWKRFFAASAVVYVAIQAIDLIVNAVFMKTDNESLKSLWRPNMSSRVWLMYLVGVLVALLFTYIFVKGREGKGLAEGVRFGIIIWLFMSVPMYIGMWVMLLIGWQIILRWLLFSLLEMLIAGILVAAIYKPAAPAKAQP